MKRVKDGTMVTKIKEKSKKLWSWLRKTVINKDMILAFIIAEVIFWSPCAILAILASMVNPWFWTGFTAVIVFWSAPLTPGWAIQIALALFIKKQIDRFHKKYIRVDNKDNNNIEKDNNNSEK